MFLVVFIIIVAFLYFGSADPSDGGYTFIGSIFRAIFISIIAAILIGLGYTGLFM